MGFPILALLGSAMGGSKDDDWRANLMQSGNSSQGSVYAGPFGQSPGYAGPFGQSPGYGGVEQSLAAGLQTPSSGELVQGATDQAASDDFWSKALGIGMDVADGAAGALGSIDQRLTNVQYPNRPMGHFAPNPNAGMVGIEQLLRMLAANGGR